MLYYTLIFLIVAVLAGFLGFTGIAGTAAWIAKVLFVVFLVLFVLALLRGKRIGLVFLVFCLFQMAMPTVAAAEPAWTGYVANPVFDPPTASDRAYYPSVLHDLEITGTLPENNQTPHDAYFMPGADQAVLFNAPATRPVTPVGPDTSTWRVRDFSPYGDSEWSSAPAITVKATAGMPTAGIPDYECMRPTDGWRVVTATGGTAPLAFAWNSVPGATGYMIYVSSAEGVPVLNYLDVGNVIRVHTIGGAPIALPAGTCLVLPDCRQRSRSARVRRRGSFAADANPRVTAVEIGAIS